MGIAYIYGMNKENHNMNKENEMSKAQVQMIVGKYMSSDRSIRNRKAKKAQYDATVQSRMNARRAAGCASGV